MELKDVEKHLIACLEIVQEDSGREAVSITAATKPLCDIPGFDSYNGVSALHEFEERAHVDLSKMPHLYFMDKNNKESTVKEIAKTLRKFINRKRKKP